MSNLAAEEIKRMAEEGESFTVDLKVSVPSKVRELTEEVCSFANASGGYILIGIDNNGKIVGAEIDNDKRSAIQGSIGEISPAVHTTMYSVDIDDKKVWVIDVPEGRKGPYVFGGRVFMREGANSQKLTNVEEIRELFQRAEKIYYDSIPHKRYDFMANIDHDFVKFFQSEARISPMVDEEQLLDSQRVTDDNGDIKRGAIMFFTKHPEDLIFHAVVRCIQFKGTDKMHIIDDKMFGGPLYRQYDQTIQWLKDRLNLEYIIEGTGARQERWEIPLDVFREAVINAISHRDYYEQGAFVNVEMYDDRIEITNPGTLLPAVAKNFGRKSISRNPYIFNLFMRMHLIEHVGHGIGKMHNLMIDAGLPAPVYETDGMFTVTFYRRAKPTLAKPRLSKAEQAMLDILSVHPLTSIDELCVILNRKKSSIYGTLKQLKEKGLLHDDSSKLA